MPTTEMTDHPAARAMPDVPSHVPPELVVDLDIYNLPTAHIDPHLAWLDFVAADKGPLVFSPYNGGHWVVTDPAALIRFQRDTANFSNLSVTLPQVDRDRFLPLESDAPLHSDYRKAIMPMFAPAALKAMEPNLREMAIGIIEGIKPNGECDFIAEFAMLFPVRVVLQILGLPAEDGFWLNGLADTFARHPDPLVKGKTLVEIEAYLDSWIEKRLDNPSDDGISRITAGTQGGCPFSRKEILSTVSLLTIGGVDSVAMHLGFIALHLASNPSALAYVKANLDQLDPIIAEYNRRFSGANICRIMSQDYEHDSITMKAGDMVAIAAPLYNLSDVIFPDAAKIDFARQTKQTHLTFGTGAHSCPGGPLARLEVKIFLQEWMKRIPDFKIKEGAPVRLRATVNSAVDEFYLQWPVEQ